MVENTSLVSHGSTIINKLPFSTPTRLLDFTIKQISATPIPKNETVARSVIRESFRNTSILSEIANVITDSCRTTTKNRYLYSDDRLHMPIKEYGSLCCRCENSPGILHGIKLKLSVYIVFYVLPAVHYPVLSQLTGS